MQIAGAWPRYSGDRQRRCSGRATAADEPQATYSFRQSLCRLAWLASACTKPAAASFTPPQDQRAAAPDKDAPVGNRDRQASIVTTGGRAGSASAPRCTGCSGCAGSLCAREDGRPLTLCLTNVCGRWRQIAALYRQRWQIELLFFAGQAAASEIPHFLGRSQNAVRVQIFAA